MVAEVQAVTELEQMAALVPGWVLEWHDARELKTDINVREAKPDEDLIASVGVSGVLQPIVAVRTAEGESTFWSREGAGEAVLRTVAGATRVRFGDRRTGAAIISKNYLVPVIVTGPEGDDKAEEIARIINQRAENTYRQGMKASEHANAAQQLSLLGVSEKDIEEGLRISKPEVKASKKLAKSSTGRAMLDENEGLDILTAAKIAEFESDPDRVERLLNLHRHNGNLEWLIDKFRSEDKAAAEVAKVRKVLETEGLTVTDASVGWSRDSAARYVTDLTDENGEALNIVGHTDCPGHAVVVEDVEYFKAPDGTLYADFFEVPEDQRDDAEEVGCLEGVAVCTQHAELHPGPAAPERSATEQLSAEEAERREAERKQASADENRRVRAGNKEWDAAEAKRRKFVKEKLVERMTPVAGAVEYLTNELLVAQYALSDSFRDGHPLAADWLGVAAGGGSQFAGDLTVAPRRTALQLHAEGVSDKKRMVLLLTVVLAANEKALNRHSWRGKDGCGQKNYLRFLIDQGYNACGTERLAAGLPEDPEAVAEAPAEGTTTDADAA